MSVGMEKKLHVEFHMQPVLNEPKSFEAGRPIFEEVEYITVFVPGEKDIVDRPIWEKDRQDYAAQYQAWKATGKQALEGTPLSVWPAVTAAQVKELAYFEVKTVEQLASMSDSAAQRFMDGLSLKRRANDFLQAAAGNAPLEKMRAELTQRDSEIEALKQMLSEQSKRIDELATKPAKK